MSEVNSNQKRETDSFTALIYFGRHGGGVYLTRDYAKEILQGDHRFVVMANSESDLMNEARSISIQIFYPFSTPSIFEFLLNPLSRYRFKGNVKDFLLDKRVSHILVSMPHYTDLLVNKICRSLNIRTGIIIHDFKSHPGEFWPSRSSILRRARSFDQVFTLSNYISSQLHKEYAINSIKLNFPVNEKAKSQIVKGDAKFSYFLLVGRLKKYKGISKFLAEWQKLTPVGKPNLLIAGRGASNFSDDGVLTIDKWLTEGELIDVMRRSEGIILPYTEASQSGILDLSIQLNLNVFLFAVGGLSEQVANYSNARVFGVGDYQGIIDSLLVNEITPNQKWVFDSNSEHKAQSLTVTMQNGF